MLFVARDLHPLLEDFLPTAVLLFGRNVYGQETKTKDKKITIVFLRKNHTSPVGTICYYEGRKPLEKKEKQKVP